MARHRDRQFRFELGLQNTQGEVGLEQPWLARADNVRVHRGNAERRKGMSKIGTVPALPTGGLLDGAGNYIVVPLDLRAHTLPRVFEIETLCDTPDWGDPLLHYLLGWSHATSWPARIFWQSGKVKAEVKDANGTVATLTSASTYGVGETLAVKVARDRGTCWLWVNGILEATDAATLDATASGFVPAGDMHIGAQAGANIHIGTMSFMRARKAVRSNQRGGWHRSLNPRSRLVLWDYVIGSTAAHPATWTEDRSLYENHGEVAAGGVPQQEVPQGPYGREVQAIREVKDPQGRRRLVVVARGDVFSGKL